MAVAITRMEYDAADLRQAAARSRDADAARRMLALALVLDGRPRTEAAQMCGMDRQTLHDWVHLSGWEETVFALLANNAVRASDYFRLPPHQVVELGKRVEV